MKKYDFHTQSCTSIILGFFSIVIDGWMDGWMDEYALVMRMLSTIVGWMDVR
jgi:hypothetical protein